MMKAWTELFKIDINTLLLLLLTKRFDVYWSEYAICLGVYLAGRHGMCVCVCVCVPWDIISVHVYWLVVLAESVTWTGHK